MKKVKWILDPMHSEIMFKVKHLMITTVTGHFGTFNAEATTGDDNFNQATEISFNADVNSIYTNNAQRDTHLKSPDFFDAGMYPRLEFTAKNYNAADGELKGDLIIRDHQKHHFADRVHRYFGRSYGTDESGFFVTGEDQPQGLWSEVECPY